MFYSRYVYDIVIIYDANRTKPEHILQNQHEYGTIAETMTLLKPSKMKACYYPSSSSTYNPSTKQASLYQNNAPVIRTLFFNWPSVTHPYTPQNRASSPTARKPDTQPSAPHHNDNLKTKVCTAYF